MAQFSTVRPGTAVSSEPAVTTEQLPNEHGIRRQNDLFILYAVISETSSNRWKLSVISDSRLSAWVVERPSMTSLTAA